VAPLLALAAAITYGAADFFGGFVTRRANVFTVVAVSQVAGTIVLASVLPFFLDGSKASAGALGWGAASGAAGALGVVLFYQALALGRMSVVAPITGVVAAALPVLYGLLTGERPRAVALLGVFIALVAVVLVSSAPEEPQDDPSTEQDRPSGQVATVLALGAGLGFAGFFILLAQAGSGAGLWPLVGARAASVSLLGIALLAARAPVRPPRGAGSLIVAAGVLDVSANLLYLLASQRGLLSLVAVITSMYPATTVVMARTILHERLYRPQILGLVAAAVGVSLIALG
jgi:drug/metabolite transporter (DMT)-like permease